MKFIKKSFKRVFCNINIFNSDMTKQICIKIWPSMPLRRVNCNLRGTSAVNLLPALNLQYICSHAAPVQHKSQYKARFNYNCTG